eukprot:gene17839-18067_t
MKPLKNSRPLKLPVNRILAAEVRSWLKTLKPPPKLTISAWADQFGHLSPETSAEPGKFRSFAYQRGMMDAVSDPEVTMVTVIKSARVGYTKCLDHIVGFYVHQDPSPILVVQPRVEDAEDYSRTEIAPMLRDTPVLAEITGSLRAKDANQRIQKRVFRNGSSISFVGANSPGGFRRITARIVLFDEVDGFPVDGAGDEGDQISLGAKRSETFWNRKIVLGSTPTIKGESRIEKSWFESDQRRYFVACPHCGHEQVLRWQNLAWQKDVDLLGKTTKHYPETAYFVCDSGNGCVIEEIDKPAMIDAGRWTNDHVFMVGVDSAKDQIYARLRIAEFGPGFIHFPTDDAFDESYFEQLTSEKVVTRFNQGRPYRVWDLPKGKRNEALDTFVYAMAALKSLPLRLDAVSKYRPSMPEDELENMLPQKLPALASSAPISTPFAVAKPAPVIASMSGRYRAPRRIDALAAAIATGVTNVSYQGKSVSYRDLNEMRLLLQMMDKALTGTKVKRRVTPRGGGKAYFEQAFEGARMRRRLANWQPSRASINQMMASDGGQLRARARDLIRNNSYAASACESFVSNLVGAGIKPSVLIDDKGLKDQIQKSWRAWSDRADYDGLTDLYGMQALIGRGMFEAGEIFVRKHLDENDEDGVPLRLQILESEMLAYEKNHMAENGNWIVNGIEIDDRNRRVAYHFYSVYPGDPYYRAKPLTYVRVPANEVLHIFRPLRPGQMRGTPWITPAMVKLFILDQYDDAELDRKKIAAMYAGFITSPNPDEMFGDDASDAPPLPAADAGIPTLEPGTMQALEPGEDIKFSSPTEVGGSYEPFQYRNLTAACTGMGVPYMAVTGDLSKANYSSQRGGLIEFRAKIEQIQHGSLIFQFCRPVWNWFLTDAVLAGELQIPDFVQNKRKYLAVKWFPPRMEWVDPLHDLQAEKLAVDNGFKSRDDVVEEMGFDPEENDRRIAASQQRAKDLGLLLADSPLGLSLSKAPPGVGTTQKPETMSRKFHTRAEAAGAVIAIFCEIGDDGAGGGISAERFNADLAALGTVKSLTLRMNSPGGDVIQGMGIYNALAATQAEVICKIEGLAASAASLIAMAADKILIASNAFMLVHEPFGSIEGTADQLENGANDIALMRDSYVAIYAKRTGMKPADILALMKQDRLMSAQEAVQLGFADDVFEPTEQSQTINMKVLPRKIRAALKTAIAKREAVMAEKNNDDGPDLADLQDENKALKAKLKAFEDEKAKAAKKAKAARADDDDKGHEEDDEDAKASDDDSDMSAEDDDDDTGEGDDDTPKGKKARASRRLVASARAKALAYSQSIVTMCAVAGRADLAIGFLSAQASIETVSKQLLKLGASSSNTPISNHRNNNDKPTSQAIDESWGKIIAKAVFLLNEVQPGTLSRDQVLLTGASGVLQAGTVLAKSTATGKYVPATSPVGAPIAELKNDKRDIRDFRTNRIAKGFTIYAEELSGIREFGTETELMQVQAEVARRAARVENDRALTFENMALGALQGIVPDADGSLIKNWYSEWGIAPNALINFTMESATTDVTAACKAIVRGMMRAGKGAFTTATKVHALVGDAFYDQLITHPSVKQFYLNWNAAQSLRDDASTPFGDFTFGGITWHNYRGTDDNSTVAIATDRAIFFPVGATETFQLALGPAEFDPWISTMGQELYALTIPDRDRNAWTKFELYSYPLFICNRPEMLFSAKRQTSST